jgi:hypothetical protein
MNRAMEGMLQALESRVNLSKGEALSPRLQDWLADIMTYCCGLG